MFVQEAARGAASFYVVEDARDWIYCGVPFFAEASEDYRKPLLQSAGSFICLRECLIIRRIMPYARCSRVGACTAPR